MLFNSLDFAIYLPIVFILYWFVFGKSLRSQNILLLLSSYVFYAWWDWRFLSLIVFSTLVDFFIGKKLAKPKTKSKRKQLLFISVLINLGLLGFFKYYNFFITSFTTAFSFFGSTIEPNLLHIILPVGISFYTFQTLSYTIDIYRKKLEPTKDLLAFATFVSFFPQLVAGPIERAKKLLPQITSKRIFKYDLAMQGIYQILWGLFKKIIIADNAAELVNIIFENDDFTGSTLVMGAFLFAFQIYGDFSGYSDIAIGVAKLFGINLMLNFSFPYFSRDMGEFWRRWHISLSTWFRDYLYIPLGGSHGSKLNVIRNVFIIFLVSGFWHGANWTFIAWGLLHALYFLPLIMFDLNRKNIEIVAKDTVFPSLKSVFTMGVTFALTVFAWIFFRAKNLSHAFDYIDRMFSHSLFKIPKLKGIENTSMLLILLFIGLLIVIEWVQRKNQFVFENLHKKSVLKQAFIVFSITIILFLFVGNQQDFIYFQF